MLDRIDLCAETKEVPFQQLQSADRQESSAQIREQVSRARQIQLVRYKGTKIQFNSQLDVEGIKRYCSINKEEQEFMGEVYHRLDLTARSYHRILKVARTIADLEGADKITRAHLSEAVCYRMADKKFWTR